MTESDWYAPVYPLPVCGWCRHLWVAHQADGCRIPAGRWRVCGCREPPPDHPDQPHDHEPDGDGQDHGEEERAA